MFIRYNAIAKIWEYDSTSLADNPDSRIGDGKAPWLPLPIDFSQLVNVPAATLPPNIAYKDQINTFISDQIISKVNPILTLTDTSQPVNSRLFRILNVNQELYIQSVDDTVSVGYGVFRVNRVGNILFSGSIFERSRTTALGEWVSFTPVWSSSGNPQPAGATQVGRYTLVGKTCIFWINMSFPSGTTFGTSTWFHTCPVPASPATPPGAMIGSAQLINANLELRIGVCLYGGSNQILTQGEKVPNYTEPGVPFVWEVGDALRISGSYETA